MFALKKEAVLHPSCGHVSICGRPNGLRDFTLRKTAARRVRSYVFPVTQRGRFYCDSISNTDMGAAKVFSWGCGAETFVANFR
jgi:hypothetical protein